MRPGDTLGILGGGQLGRMLALAAARLGLGVHVYAPEPDSPAFAVAARHTVAAYEDEAALARFAAEVGVVTFEWENIPVAPLRTLPRVAPSPDALAVAQDRLHEKAFFAAAGLPVAPHARVDDLAGLDAAVGLLGTPAILKTRRFGYDGKGQVRIAAGDDLGDAWAAVGGVPSILEAVVPFVAETSTVLARGADGRWVAWDAPLNRHEDGILRRSTLPGPLSPSLAAEAEAMTAAVAERLGYVGVVAIEWFVTETGGLVANEMAPRVHNTGHWTEDGALTSQFENHVRAVAGWPLGDTRRLVDVEMVNLIGAEADGWRRHLDNPAARLHLYGKREARPGRKMGHVNLVGGPVDKWRRGC